MPRKPAIRYPRGKVTAQQELCLQLHKEYLTAVMNCLAVVQKLRTMHILNSNDEDYILGTGGSKHDQNSRLVDTISRREPRGFDAFVRALGETGHDAAYRKLCQTMHYRLDDRLGREDLEYGGDYRQDMGHGHRHFPFSKAGDGLHQEHGYEDDAVRHLLDRVDYLSSSVESVKNRMDILGMRVNNVDAGKKVEMDRLKWDLGMARAELDRLIRENEELSSVLKDKSEKLEEARAKLADVEKRIQELEVENDGLRQKTVDQAKRLELMQTRAKQTQEKLADIEKQVVDQGRQHKKALDDHKFTHRKDTDQLKRRLNQEQEKRESLEKKVHELEQHKKASEDALKKMQERLLRVEQNMHALMYTPAGKPKTTDSKACHRENLNTARTSNATNIALPSTELAQNPAWRKHNQKNKSGPSAHPQEETQNSVRRNKARSKSSDRTQTVEDNGAKRSPRGQGQKLNFPTIFGKGRSQNV